MLRLIGITMKQQKKKLLLLLIQFFVGFFALFYAVAMIENVLQFKEQVEDMSTLQAFQIADYKEYEAEKEEKFVQKYEESVQEISELKSIEKVGIFENNMYQLEGFEDFEVKGVKANGDMLSMTKWKLEKGSVEELLAYQGQTEEIPIVITKELEEMCPYEGVFQARVVTEDGELVFQSYKVVGVLSSKMKFWSGYMIPMAESLEKDTEPYFISPTNENKFSLDTYGYNTLIVATEGMDVEKARSQVVDLYEKHGIKIDTYTLAEQVEEYYKGQRTFIITITVFSIILLLLSVLGCNGTLLAGIMRRKEEFGIYVTMGLTKKHLLGLVFGELFFLFLLAFSLAIGACGVLLAFMETTTNVTMNGRIAGIGLCVMVVAVFVSAILPLRKVNALQPIELVETKE